MGHPGIFEQGFDRSDLGGRRGEALGELFSRQIVAVVAALRRRRLRYERFEVGGILQRQVHGDSHRPAGGCRADQSRILYPARDVTRCGGRLGGGGRTDGRGSQQAA